MKKRKLLFKTIRKVWEINPRTRVKPLLKKARREKDIIRKEIEEEKELNG